jgi:two-component system nitrogen regulation response regulator GlnG
VPAAKPSGAPAEPARTAAIEPIATAAARPPMTASGGWESGLEAEALELLAAGRHDVWEALTKRFESKLILTALANTRGRRIEAAQKLGIGRNTITRKIQELGLE